MRMFITATAFIIGILVQGTTSQQLKLSHEVETIKAKTCFEHVYGDEKGNKLIKLRNDGTTCGLLPLVVSEDGFNFDAMIPEYIDKPIFLKMSFPLSSTAILLSFSLSFQRIIVRANDVLLAKAESNIIAFEIGRDGRLSVHPRLHDSPTVSTSIMEKAPKYGSSLAIVSTVMSWNTSGYVLTVRLPPNIGVLDSVTPSLSITTSTNASSLSKSDFAPSRELQSVEKDQLTDAKNSSSPSLSDPNTEDIVQEEPIVARLWFRILIGVVIVVLASAIVAIVVAVAKFCIRRYRRKSRPSTTARSTVTSQETPADIHIDFAGYDLFVPGHPEEVEKFKAADPQQKAIMMDAFLKRRQQS
uniref:CUB domain-containing protein n=1 Tax=Panagrellus redivivus TaxID=6233 RepID=A0A7E4ZRZ1_PANRE